MASRSRRRGERIQREVRVARVVAGLPAPQHAPGREGARVPRAHGGRGPGGGGPRSCLLHRLGRGPAGPARRGQDDPGGGCGRRLRRAPAPGRALRVGDRRRGHEDDLLHPDRHRPLQAGLHAVGVQRRHRHLHREDRPQAPGGERAARGPTLRGHEPPQGEQQVRHLRGDRRQQPRQDRGAGRGDHREPLRGGGVPEPRHPHQGQYPGPGGVVAGRAEPLLQGIAGGLAPPPRQVVGAAEARAARGARSRVAHHRARGGALLRLPRLRGDRGGRGGRHRGLSGPRPAALVGRGGSAGGEGQDGGPSARRLRGGSHLVRGRVRPQALGVRPGRRGGGGPGAGRLRLRQHHRQGGRALARALTGYGKDLLRDVVGADVAVVETVAHATGTLHFHPDADVICDVGGTDVKIMILRQGTVADFRLNSQCSSGNGAFLQGVAERYSIPLEAYAEKAFAAKAMPTLAMGCGVFLQSDIVNQQRKGWAAEEIMAALAAVLPVNVWIYAGQLQNLRSVGRKFVLQGGTHRNMAVVKAQVDFIRGKVPEAEVVLHPYSGEAGAIGAALCAADWREGGAGRTSRFRGFEAIAALTYTSTTAADTVCKWCPINCTRTFIDVQLPGAKGRPWSKLPLAAGWERVISGNSCPKGLVEDVNELREVKTKLEEVKRDYPNVAEMVRKDAFRRSHTGSEAVAG